MDWLKSFFEVYIRKQTYLNLVYLLLAFPLGLSYFVFLITGLSVGLGLLIIWVGILILLLVYAIWYGMLALERILAIYLLNEDIPPMIKRNLSGKSLWEKFTATLGSSVTWKGFVHCSDGIRQHLGSLDGSTLLLQHFSSGNKLNLWKCTRPILLADRHPAGSHDSLFCGLSAPDRFPAFVQWHGTTLRQDCLWAVG
jgi:hypothetical protein